MSSRKKALAAIEKKGALLVYPLNNKKEPKSIWSELYPRSKMVWEWDADSDGRVSELWYLKTEFSSSRKVVYSKWYQGRATFFSRDVFVQLLAYLQSVRFTEQTLSRDSRTLLEALQMDSPLSTKQLKQAAEMPGRANEAKYNRAMKTLWSYLLIVGFGEFEDSSFPSLAVGATQNIFEDLWLEAQTLDIDVAEQRLEKSLGPDSPFFQFAAKLRSQA